MVRILKQLRTKEKGKRHFCKKRAPGPFLLPPYVPPVSLSLLSIFFFLLWDLCTCDLKHRFSSIFASVDLEIPHIPHPQHQTSWLLSVLGEISATPPHWWSIWAAI